MIELVEGKKHQVIKRNGTSEEYNPDKMYKVLLWACKNNEILAKELLRKIDIKVFDRITISKLFEEVIETAANLISDMYPIWDDVAKRLYLQKTYKETWNIKRSEYPYYGEVLKKGAQYGVYDRTIIDSFTPQEVEELNSYIDPERDFNLDYLGLTVFVAKQSKKYTANKILELPQHGFMRLAIFAFWKEPNNRLELIQERYNQLSNFMYSEATPKWTNSMEYNPQMASCVVSRMPDVSKDINKTSSNMGIFSKFGGGLSIDITPVRCTGSRIGKSGKSSGPVPFIKVLEAIVGAYNQNGCVSRNNYVKRIKEIEKDGVIYNIKDFIVKFGSKAILEYLEPTNSSEGKGSTSKLDYRRYKHSLDRIGKKEDSPFSPEFYINETTELEEAKILAKAAYDKASEKAMDNGGHQIKGGDNSSLNALIEKYGAEIGQSKYDIQNKISKKITSEYLQELYGFTPEEAKDFKNNCSLDKFILRYGEELGQEKYNDFLKRSSQSFSGFSKESNNFIEQILVPYLRKEHNMVSHQYVANGGEFILLTEDSKLYKYDFVSEDLKLIVEYHGIAFHPKEGDLNWTNPFGKKYSEQFKIDSLKKDLAEKFGYKYVTIYSDEVEESMDIVKEILCA